MICKAEGSDGLDGPASLTAITRNSYSTPFRNPVVENVVPGVWPTFTQVGLPFSLFSTIYSLIGAPPLLVGGFHSISILFSSQSVTVGDSGATGTSKTNF